MAVTVKLKYVDELSGGRKRFRRRIPRHLRESLGAEFFQEPMKAREGAAMVREHEQLLRRYDNLIAKAENVVEGLSSHSPRDQWADALAKGAQMQAEVTGPVDEQSRRDLLADNLAESGVDPLLYRAVRTPSATPPAHTLQDAVNMYVKERLNGPDSDGDKVRLNRVFKRVKAALGDLSSVELVNLKREQARAVRDYMLNSTRNGGGTLSPATVRRELNLVTAVVSLAITEFDLAGSVSNPFEKLPVERRSSGALKKDGDDRDPLPANVIAEMRKRMTGELRVPALGLIWRILAGTGCRMAEVTGLQVEDVVLADDLPHLLIKPNATRRLKTKASIRSVPLVGDALVAATEAVRGGANGSPLFPPYAGPRGADGASQSLMKHLRKVTGDTRHTNHSLRHNMKDWLREAGVSVLDQNLLLGHTLGCEGDTAYGGEKAKLVVTTRALEKAMGAGRYAPYSRQVSSRSGVGCPSRNVRNAPN